MAREQISQRALAAHLGISQGHLSKVLSSKHPGGKMVRRILTNWLDPAEQEAERHVPAEEELLRAARAAAGGSTQVMHLLAQMMHQVGLVRQVRPAGKEHSATTRSRKGTPPPG